MVNPVKEGPQKSCNIPHTTECRRQSKLVAEADATDRELLDFMDSALSNMDDWTT